MLLGCIVTVLARYWYGIRRVSVGAGMRGICRTLLWFFLGIGMVLIWEWRMDFLAMVLGWYRYGIGRVLVYVWYW